MWNGMRSGSVVMRSEDHIGGTSGAVKHHPEVANVQILHYAGDLRKVDQHRSWAVEITRG